MISRQPVRLSGAEQRLGRDGAYHGDVSRVGAASVDLALNTRGPELPITTPTTPKKGAKGVAAACFGLPHS
jgi:hypothetical protein